MKSTTNKGFTLIELLVVIAIIGILSGIAIFGLSDARKKGQDAAIIAAIGQIPAQAAIYFDDNNSFGTSATCGGGVFASTNVDKAIDDADAVSAGSPTCHAAGTKFAVSIPLVATTTSYCVDSEGFTGNGTAQTSGICS
jgi:prepilin-type N-terminal cleavage/methylation domain-containing protein